MVKKEQTKYAPGMEQYVKITLSKTGDKGVDVPGGCEVEVHGVTARQMFFAWVVLTERVVQEFGKPGENSLAKYIYTVLSRAQTLSNFTEKLKNIDKDDTDED